MSYWQDIKRNWQVRVWVKETNGLVLAGTFGYILILRSYPGSAALAYFTLFWLAVNIAQLHTQLSGQKLLSLEGIRYKDLLPQVATVIGAIAVVIVVALASGARYMRFPGPETTGILLFGAISETLAWPYVWARILPFGTITSSLFFAAAHPQTVAMWLATGTVTAGSLLFFFAAVGFNLLGIFVIAMRDVGDRSTKKLFGFFAFAGIHFAVNYGIFLFTSNPFAYVFSMMGGLG